MRPLRPRRWAAALSFCVATAHPVPSHAQAGPDMIVTVDRNVSPAAAYRIEVSLTERRLWVLDRADTVYHAPVAIGSGETVRYGAHRWTFHTPLGTRVVRSKTANPVWTPPLWHYAEVATEYGLRMRILQRGHPVRLKNGDLLVVRGHEVGVIDHTTRLYGVMGTTEHIVFDNTVFVPPPGTDNSHVDGELGKYRLDLGNGVLLHGTPDQRSIGHAVTHGCVRLADDDIRWLYENIPVGTKVEIQR
jgi:lipoprotein-anchoring transpeptidase ErfK/SrfK